LQSEGKIPRNLKNPAERQLFNELISQGWYVTKRGFPDFACFKGDNLALVEVKPTSTRRLRRDQYRLMVRLAEFGVKCFRWSPDSGYHPISATFPDLSRRELKKQQKSQNGRIEGEQKEKEI
jgi:hypothetical protein